LTRKRTRPLNPPEDVDLREGDQAVDLRESAGASVDLDCKIAGLLAEDGRRSGVDTYEKAVEAHQLPKYLVTIGRLEEAVNLYRRALVIKEQILGAGHPELATTTHNLALLLKSMGETEKAASLWVEARAALDPVRPTTEHSGPPQV